MKTRWALVVMGAWVMGSICMSVVATQNFHTIDRLLAGSTQPDFQALVQKLGHATARDLLRYLSSELNRLYFQSWNLAQLALGGVVLWLLGSRPRPSARRGVIVMLAIVAAMLVYLTPQIVSLGRSLDFVPRETPPPGLSRFWMLHAAYTSLEMIKLAVGVLVAWWLVSNPEAPAAGPGPARSSAG